MGEITTFTLKTIIIVIAIPFIFLLTYFTGLLISKLAAKYCPEYQKRKKAKRAGKKYSWWTDKII